MVSGEDEISQDEIEALLGAAAEAESAAPAGDAEGADLDALLAGVADEQPAADPSVDLSAATPFKLPALSESTSPAEEMQIDSLHDVELEVKVVLGRNSMFVEQILKLREGSVVELDKLAGDPLDILVNDRPVARGEVLVLNNNFCIRVTEIIDQAALGSPKK